MALKILYTHINGTLTADISSVTNVLPIDAASLAILQANVDFAGGDWTYLELNNGIYSEQVKVTGISNNYLVVTRGVSGSVGRTFAASNTEINDAVGQDAIKDIIAANPSPSAVTVSGGEIAQVTEPTQGNYKVTVEYPQFSGSGGIVITGEWPTLTFNFEGGDEGCCSGGATAGGVTSVVVQSSILTATVQTDVLNIALPEPTFTGAGGVTVTGSWADGYTISGGGAGGTGTVTSVDVGTGLTLTGIPNTNPTISITNTGVTAGIYGGFTINAQGQITDVTAGYSPVGSLAFANGADVVLDTTSYTVTLHTADVGVQGIVALADSAAPLDSNDDVNAVTPKLLSSAISTLSAAVVGAGSTNGEADASYTNILSTTGISVNLSSTQKALVIGEIQMMDGTTPSSPVAFGVAVFNATNVKLYGSKTATQSKQAFSFLLTGPINTTISIATTAVPSGASITTSELAAVIF